MHLAALGAPYTPPPVDMKIPTRESVQAEVETKKEQEDKRED